MGLVGSQRLWLEEKFRTRIRDAPFLGPLVAYVPNKCVPLLRLYRFKEAFSLPLVEYFLSKFQATKDDYLLDPFAGMGSSLFAAMLRGIASIGIDRLPIATFVASTLPRFLSFASGELTRALNRLRPAVDRCQPATIALDVPLIRLAFDEDRLTRLRKWKTAIDTLEDPARSAFLLLFFSVLMDCSYGSNDGQFIRIKRNKKPRWPDEAIENAVFKAELDIAAARAWARSGAVVEPRVLLADSRRLEELDFHTPPTLVITSPPYLNRYDYTRSYCLELCFHFVANFEELRNLRHSILRSHIESRLVDGERPCHPAVTEVLENLKAKNLNNPKIPDMIAAYFVDMEKVICGLSELLAVGARVAMVVDNVRFEGEMIPVDLILSEMAERAGFSVSEILVCRYKGNSSQQMGRYGRLPVRESVLIWRKEPT